MHRYFLEDSISGAGCLDKEVMWHTAQQARREVEDKEDLLWCLAKRISCGKESNWVTDQHCADRVTCRQSWALTSTTRTKPSTICALLVSSVACVSKQWIRASRTLRTAGLLRRPSQLMRWQTCWMGCRPLYTVKWSPSS